LSTTNGRSVSSVFGRRYLFHVHSQFADGSASVEDYLRLAQAHDLETVTILEHARRIPSYSVQRYADTIRETSNRLGIRALVGFEVKLDSDGSLDINDETLALADVVGLAVHKFPNDFMMFMKAFSSVLRLCSDKIRVWVHPGLWFVRRGILEEKFLVYTAMLNIAVSEGWFIEYNLKYNLIPRSWRKLVHRSKLVTGVDAHSIDDVRKHIHLL
jgi:histidinol phosphatase-like PHP family hydrolase